jgi:predicted methyltransferase
MLRTLAAGILVFAAGLCHADPLREALDSPDRPDADRERDVTSQPAAVLRFFGIPEGGVAVDLFAGGGYYSEILARAMGPESRVYLHNNAAYLGFAEDEIEERLKGSRLPNVVRYDRELDGIDLADDSVDLVLMVLTYHDLYYKTDGWDQDPDGFFAMVHRILKPGGVLAVVDHVGAAGSGSSAAQELHRIDPAFAKADIEGRGFEFAGELSVLRNDSDPLDVSVFDDSVRRKTSRFAYRFLESR